MIKHALSAERAKYSVRLLQNETKSLPPTQSWLLLNGNVRKIWLRLQAGTVADAILGFPLIGDSDAELLHIKDLRIRGKPNRELKGKRFPARDSRDKNK